jgi:hypothetical protein
LEASSIIKCVICGLDFEPSERTFEQRLIEDTDFCRKCFAGIMTAEYESDEGYLEGLLTLAE